MDPEIPVNVVDLGIFMMLRLKPDNTVDIRSDHYH